MNFLFSEREPFIGVDAIHASHSSHAPEKRASIQTPVPSGHAACNLTLRALNQQSSDDKF